LWDSLPDTLPVPGGGDFTGRVTVRDSDLAGVVIRSNPEVGLIR
jgi:hypothetical protein